MYESRALWFELVVLVVLCQDPAVSDTRRSLAVVLLLLVLFDADVDVVMSVVGS